MARNRIEQTFERERDGATTSRKTRADAPTTAQTLSVTEDKAAHRRAEAQRLGRHPAPLNEGRSRNMQAIRRKDTKPEVALRSALHRLGHRFRKDLRVKAGDAWVRPDIVFPRHRVAVFVDGCFWHGCPDHGRQPKINDWYWSPKLQRTRDRDARNTAALLASGWCVLRLWEHEPLDAAVQSVVASLCGTTDRRKATRPG